MFVNLRQIFFRGILVENISVSKFKKYSKARDILRDTENSIANRRTTCSPIYTLNHLFNAFMGVRVKTVSLG